MEEIVIRGGRPLRGDLQVSGAKNAALPIMAASLLVPEPTTLHHVPRLRDVQTMCGILEHLGTAVDWLGPESVRLTPGGTQPHVGPCDLVRDMRGSVCVLGPLLATRGAVVLPAPGGCVIGKRPIDLHVKGLEALGARFRLCHPYVYAQAGELTGTRIDMAGPRGYTVLGTANVMMAAVLARGRTVIESAASEPEVQDVAHFLNRCGARIAGIGSNTLTIDGVDRLQATEYTIIPDRIEAGTFLAAAALTGGRIRLAGACPDHMRAELDVFRRAGLDVQEGNSVLTGSCAGPLRPVDVRTGSYPHFSTDMHPQVCAVLCLARGRSVLHETVYPERFTHVEALNRMGARVSVRGASSVIDGPASLRGAAVHAADLRAGAALVLAGLAAEGETVVRGVAQIDRGYDQLVRRLALLGADISRREAEAAAERKRA
ncbi:MAG: UDP-N-acetylglucosamine 1-carboxyvinyltransferase [Candidatus Brocadiaceae bacterium]|nr:UDP-N-acetylglucosamine 1-carboxyvinyltransferase [Candidatus Brocadiaceae bacterium]